MPVGFASAPTGQPVTSTPISVSRVGAWAEFRGYSQRLKLDPESTEETIALPSPIQARSWPVTRWKVICRGGPGTGRSTRKRSLLRKLEYAAESHMFSVGEITNHSSPREVSGGTVSCRLSRVLVEYRKSACSCLFFSADPM